MKVQQEKKVYEIFTTKNKFLMRVEAGNISDAADQVKSYWPCNIRGSHMKVPNVLVDSNGTLDFTGGKYRVRD